MPHSKGKSKRRRSTCSRKPVTARVAQAVEAEETFFQKAKRWTELGILLGKFTDTVIKLAVDVQPHIAHLVEKILEWIHHL